MIKVLKSLLYSERNQQTMCTDGFVKDLFTFCNAALVDESHLFHQSIQYMFESMAAQSLKPNDLRYTLPHPSAASSAVLCSEYSRLVKLHHQAVIFRQIVSYLMIYSTYFIFQLCIWYFILLAIFTNFDFT